MTPDDFSSKFYPKTGNFFENLPIISLVKRQNLYFARNFRRKRKMADPIINPAMQTQQVITPTVPVQKKSSGFGRIFGGILGGALNIVAPGLGSIVGGALGSGSGANIADMQTMMNQQMQQSMQLLSVQNRVQSQSQEFTTMSNLLKSKHDSEMSAVNNFKS